MKTNHVIEKMLCAGRWVEAASTFPVYNPQDGRLIAEVPSASKTDMEEAVEGAHRAFSAGNPWPTHERMNVLKKAADYVREHRESFAEVIAMEGSKTITEARGEVKRTIQTIEISAEEARRLKGETINFDQNEGSENRVGYYQRFPIGVIGAITPFNDPLNLVAHKIGPAIAAGNAVVLKPASVTPLSALKLAEAFTAAGLPEGYLSVITGSGKDIGDALITHPAVQMISFTGGPEAGEAITKKAGVKKVSMELGSNSPVIILQDADREAAVKACVSGAFSAAGQNCIGVQRIYVEEQQYGAFLDEFAAAAAALNVGDKMDETTDVGPMIQEKEAVRVENWVEEAVGEGAEIVLGGKRDGTFYYPTILTGVPHDAKAAREEIFGPVVLVHPVRSLDEAIELSNSVNYGLHAGIFTNNIQKAFEAVQYMDVGGLMINDSSDYRIDEMPFGGTKGSGIGREGVRFSMEAMTEQKVVCFQLNSR
ncbi:aldehyde dehydrogenase family protein [Halobacillus litoralis]|uniref:aldehyde dehydrogenase family protein n=1 Tax=Halobacillus litoralis TaxID=45668 RepID=UPI001CD81133|nr:aldehyde dehydrogenase family protein [Halobacillus litoralis]MCA1020717.1 aldehyde dehydrogenase family protein [Halobacillus litoralis]